MKTKRTVAALAVGTLALTMVACGSSSGDQATEPVADAGASARVVTAQAAGEKAAAAEGESVPLEKKTIGFLNLVKGDESTGMTFDAAEQAAKALGWSVIECDGKGIPAQWVACGDSLLSQGVDAIVQTAIDEGPIKSVVDKAHAQGVPVIQISGGEIPNGSFDGNFGPDEVKKSQILSDAVVEKLDALPGEKAEVVLHVYPAAWAQARSDEFKKVVAGQSKVEVVAESVSDAANLVSFTQKTVADQLTRFSDVNAFVFFYDSTAQVASKVIGQRYPGKSFPDRPLVASFHATPQTLELMRQGSIDMVVDSNFWVSSWIAMDQLAEYFARDAEISTENQPDYPEFGNLFREQLVTQDDLPPAGQLVTPEIDVPGYFEAKWAAEFTG